MVYDLVPEVYVIKQQNYSIDNQSRNTYFDFNIIQFI